jgi:hypothetical protein
MISRAPARSATDSQENKGPDRTEASSGECEKFQFEQVRDGQP